MSGLDVKNKNDSNNLDTRKFVFALCLIALTILGFYFGNFHGGLSSDNGVWGTFGDYVGGILNPLIAAFAFYLIAESYKLQKRELAETRKLLEVSTNAQKDQIKLAALTALLNSNMARINMLETRKHLLFQGKTEVFENKLEREFASTNLIGSICNYKEHRTEEEITNLANEIRSLVDNNSEIEASIRLFLKTN